MIATGKSTKEIAELLHISVKTVDVTRTALYYKIGARSCADAARMAVEQGLLAPAEPMGNNKIRGFDPKTRDHDMAILIAEIELCKANERKAWLEVEKLKEENVRLRHRNARAT